MCTIVTCVVYIEGTAVVQSLPVLCAHEQGTPWGRPTHRQGTPRVQSLPVWDTRTEYAVCTIADCVAYSVHTEKVHRVYYRYLCGVHGRSTAFE